MSATKLILDHVYDHEATLPGHVFLTQPLLFLVGPLGWLHARGLRSLPFNRYLMNQLNERLGQFIAAREIDRSADPDLRVARSLASLFHPVLYPGVGELLRITQQELAYLVGLSRQRVNEALSTLERLGWIRVEYGGVKVLDLQALRSGQIDPPSLG